MASSIPVLLPLTICRLGDTNITDPLVFSLAVVMVHHCKNIQWFDVSSLSLAPDPRLRPLLRHTGMGFNI